MKFKTYTQWLESTARKEFYNWAVTYELLEFGLTIERHCEILQWENSNAKWYRLLPFEGREEAGCYWDIWLKNRIAKIVNVRSI